MENEFDLVVAAAVAVAERKSDGVDYTVVVAEMDDSVLHGLMILVRRVVGDLVRTGRLLSLSVILRCVEMDKARRTGIEIIPLPTHTQSTHSSINPHSR
jgi:hypothetical protein